MIDPQELIDIRYKLVRNSDSDTLEGGDASRHQHPARHQST